MGPVGRVERQRDVAARIVGAVHHLGVPGRAVIIRVLEVVVSGVIVADVGVTGTVQRQRRVQPHVTAVIHRVDLPGERRPQISRRHDSSCRARGAHRRVRRGEVARPLRAGSDSNHRQEQSQEEYRDA
jgi:hypothetical protein